MSDYTVRVTWTLDYDASEIREEMFGDTGEIPTADEVQERIQELAMNEFQNCEHARFLGEITVEWDGDTDEFDSEKK